MNRLDFSKLGKKLIKKFLYIGLVSTLSIIVLQVRFKTVAQADASEEVSILKAENRISGELYSIGNADFNVKTLPYVFAISANGVNLEDKTITTKTTKIDVVLDHKLSITDGLHLITNPSYYFKIVLLDNHYNNIGESVNKPELNLTFPTSLFSKKYIFSFQKNIMTIENLHLSSDQVNKPLYVALLLSREGSKYLAGKKYEGLAKFEITKQPPLKPKVDRLYVDSDKITGIKARVDSKITSSVPTEIEKDTESKYFELLLKPGALIGQDSVTVKESGPEGVGYVDVPVENPFTLTAVHPNLERSNQEIKNLISKLQKPPKDNKTYYADTFEKIGDWSGLTVSRSGKPQPAKDFMWTSDMPTAKIIQGFNGVIQKHHSFELEVYGIHGDDYETPPITLTFSAKSERNMKLVGAFEFGKHSVPVQTEIVLPQAWPRMVVRHAAGDQNWSVNVGANVDRGIQLFYRKSDGRVVYLSKTATTKLDQPVTAASATTTTFGEDWYQHKDAQRDTGIFMELHPDVQVGQHKMAIQWVITNAP